MVQKAISSAASGCLDCITISSKHSTKSTKLLLYSKPDTGVAPACWATVTVSLYNTLFIIVSLLKSEMNKWQRNIRQHKQKYNKTDTELSANISILKY